MAKVTMPLMSGSARGKVGPLVFNQHRGFNVVKGLKSPTQPNTPAQLEARARMAQISAAWAGLSDAQRSAWAQYANDHLETDWSGVPKRLTAQNMFIRCNTRLLMLSKATIDSPPLVEAPAAPTGINVTCAGGEGTAVSLAWTAPTAATSFIVVYSAGPISPGRQPRVEQAAIIAKFAGSTASPHEVIAGSAKGRYGFWVQVIDSATGLASGPIYDEVTVS